MTEKDIYSNGVALLEEWEDVNYCEHSFKFKDEWLTDKEVVDLLNKLADENEKLKKDCSNLIDDNTEYVSEMNHIKQVIKEAYNNERTQLGKSVLKQLMEQIQ